VTHRAEQIIDAVVAKLAAAGIAAAKQRTLSYDPDMELPAVSVRMGADQPLEAQNLTFIDSLLAVVVVTIDAAATESDTIAKLMALRTSSHVALMADQTQGLNFVSDTRYGGASAPELETVGEKVAGRLETTWQIPYRMEIADPS
jgi:hypothetical protein